MQPEYIIYYKYLKTSNQNTNSQEDEVVDICPFLFPFLFLFLWEQAKAKVEEQLVVVQDVQEDYCIVALYNLHQSKSNHHDSQPLTAGNGLGKGKGGRTASCCARCAGR